MTAHRRHRRSSGAAWASSCTPRQRSCPSARAGTRRHPALRTGARELAPLTTAAAAWAVHGHLDPAEFHRRLLPRWAPHEAVDGLRRAAEGAAHAESRAELHNLAHGFAATLRTVGVDHWPALVHESALLAQQQGQASDMLHYIVLRRHARRAAGRDAAPGLDSDQNVRDLAAVMWTEARGQSVIARLAVGSTLLNRMRCNGTTSVRAAWGGYQHNVPPETVALDEARRLLSLALHVRGVGRRRAAGG